MKLMMKKRIWTLVAAAAVLAIVIACGGGGGGGGGGGATQGTVNSTTASQALAMLMATNSTGDQYVMGASSVDAAGSTPKLRSAQQLGLYMLNLAQGEMPFQDGGLQILGSEVGPAEPCSDGGTRQLTISWDGPDDATDCSQASNVRMTMTFANCNSSGYVTDGVVEITYYGSACDRPTSASIQFTGYSESAPSGDSLTMSNFQMDYEFTYSGSSIVGVTTTYDGDMAINSESMSFDMDYDNFVVSMTQTGPDTLEVTINGSLTGGCLDGWLTVETLSPIVVDYSVGDCPIAGSVRFTGEGEATVTFNPDGSADVTVGAETTTYPSCNDLPETCN